MYRKDSKLLIYFISFTKNNIRLIGAKWKVVSGYVGISLFIWKRQDIIVSLISVYKILKKFNIQYFLPQFSQENMLIIYFS